MSRPGATSPQRDSDNHTLRARTSPRKAPSWCQALGLRSFEPSVSSIWVGLTFRSRDLLTEIAGRSPRYSVARRVSPTRSKRSRTSAIMRGESATQSPALPSSRARSKARSNCASGLNSSK